MGPLERISSWKLVRRKTSKWKFNQIDLHPFRVETWKYRIRRVGIESTIVPFTPPTRSSKVWTLWSSSSLVGRYIVSHDVLFFHSSVVVVVVASPALVGVFRRRTCGTKGAINFCRIFNQVQTWHPIRTVASTEQSDRCVVREWGREYEMRMKLSELFNFCCAFSGKHYVLLSNNNKKKSRTYWFPKLLQQLPPEHYLLLSKKYLNRK